MARYMLDTDTCSYIMKRSNQTVLNRLQAIPVTDVCISVITKSESRRAACRMLRR
jgi:predicted nucleic acid-binding protein